MKTNEFYRFHISFSFIKTECTTNENIGILSKDGIGSVPKFSKTKSIRFGWKKNMKRSYLWQRYRYFDMLVIVLKQNEKDTLYTFVFVLLILLDIEKENIS